MLHHATHWECRHGRHDSLDATTIAHLGLIGHIRAQRPEQPDSILLDSLDQGEGVHGFDDSFDRSDRGEMRGGGGLLVATELQQGLEGALLDVRVAGILPHHFHDRIAAASLGLGHDAISSGHLRVGFAAAVAAARSTVVRVTTTAPSTAALAARSTPSSVTSLSAMSVRCYCCCVARPGAGNHPSILLGASFLVRPCAVVAREHASETAAPSTTLPGLVWICLAFERVAHDVGRRVCEETRASELAFARAMEGPVGHAGGLSRRREGCCLTAGARKGQCRRSTHVSATRWVRPRALSRKRALRRDTVHARTAPSFVSIRGALWLGLAQSPAGAV